MNYKKYASSFWNEDISDNSGVDIVCEQMRNGKHIANSICEIFKQRAQIEDAYAKSLLKLVQHPVPPISGSLGKSWEGFCVASEKTGQSHQKLAQSLSELHIQFNAFCQSQNSARKSTELNIKRLQQEKKNVYEKLRKSAEDYHRKCEMVDSSETYLGLIQNDESRQKEVEKTKKNLAKGRKEQDRTRQLYMAQIENMNSCRLKWESGTETSLEQFQLMEEHRIDYLRKLLWQMSNIVSETCVQVDQGQEILRKILEGCTVSGDIQSFVNENKTGNKRPGPIKFEEHQSVLKKAMNTNKARQIQTKSVDFGRRTIEHVPVAQNQPKPPDIPNRNQKKKLKDDENNKQNMQASDDKNVNKEHTEAKVEKPVGKTAPLPQPRITIAQKEQQQKDTHSENRMAKIENKNGNRNEEQTEEKMEKPVRKTPPLPQPQITIAQKEQQQKEAHSKNRVEKTENATIEQDSEATVDTEVLPSKNQGETKSKETTVQLNLQQGQVLKAVESTELEENAGSHLRVQELTDTIEKHEASTTNISERMNESNINRRYSTEKPAPNPKPVFLASRQNHLTDVKFEKTKCTMPIKENKPEVLLTTPNEKTKITEDQKGDEKEPKINNSDILDKSKAALVKEKSNTSQEPNVSEANRTEEKTKNTETNAIEVKRALDTLDSCMIETEKNHTSDSETSVVELHI